MGKLDDILELVENNSYCIILRVKENKRLELIKMGYFSGEEEMFRITKIGSTRTFTIFYDNGKRIAYDFGHTRTLVSEELNNIRILICDYVAQKFNIK